MKKLFCKTGRFFALIYYTFWFMIFFTVPVHAYVDPSVMTYAIQAIAGAAIALGSLFNIYWNRVRRKIPRNDKIIKESDELVFRDPEGGNVYTVTGTHSEQENVVVKERTLRLQDAFILVAVISFMLTIYAPLEIYFHNKTEFWFDFYSLFPECVKMFAVMLAGGCLAVCVLRLLHKKIFNGAVVLVLLMYILTYIQGNFLSGWIPAIDGRELNQADYIVPNVITVVLFILLCYGAYRVVKKGEGMVWKVLHYTVRITTALLVISLCVICFQNRGLRHKNSHFISKDNEFVFSTQQNVILLLLDATDGRQFASLLMEEPEYRTVFEDFTHFENTVGGYPHTLYAIPHLLSGIWNENTMIYEDYTELALNSSPILKYIREENYRTGMYDTEMSVMQKNGIEYYDNTKKQTNRVADPLEFSTQQLLLTGYKYAPYFWKSLFKVDFNKIISCQEPIEGHEAFTWENNKFYRDLRNADPQIIGDKCFRYYHLEGAHVPYVYNEQVVRIKKSSYRDSLKCCITIADELIRTLKESGVYDQSIIIILGDHGEAPEIHRDYAQNPLLLIKGLNEHHTYRTSLKSVSYADFADALVEMMKGGIPEETLPERKERRYFYYYYSLERHLEEYIQHGYAWDDQNIVPTGKTYDLK